MAKSRSSPASYYGTKDQIDFLRKLSESGAPINSFEYALNSVLTAKRLTCTTLLNNEIFRARWNEAGKLFDFEHELIYPKADTTSIPKGRLNDAGQSILYASVSVIGTLIELRPHLNKFFTISTLRRKPESSPWIYIVGDVRNQPNIQNPNSSDRLVQMYLDSELVKSVSTLNEYNSTIAIANHLLHKNLVGDANGTTNMGLVYPSVESKKIASSTTYNIAFLPHIFDKHYTVSSTSVYVLVDKPTTYELHEVNKGSIKAGKIEWQCNIATMKERIAQGLTITGAYCPEIKGLEAVL